MEDLPIDYSETGRPTRLFHISDSPRQSDQSKDSQPRSPHAIAVYDLRSTLQDASLSTGSDATVQSISSWVGPDARQGALAATDKQSPLLYSLHAKSGMASSRAEAKDSEGRDVASWESLVLKMGMSSVHFQGEVPACDHEVQVRPVSVHRRDRSFAIDSVPYLWQAEARFEKGRLHLYKVHEQKRYPVALYESTTGSFALGGLLAIDGRVSCHPLVVVMTLYACLKQRDAFNFPSSS